jgi:2-phospho-L-lactate guanylyltransferase
MQATVATFDEDTRSGTVLLDDGTPLGFSTDAFAASGLRLLRSGQRVRLVRTQDGTIVNLSLITMP